MQCPESCSRCALTESLMRCVLHRLHQRCALEWGAAAVHIVSPSQGRPHLFKLSVGAQREQLSGHGWTMESDGSEELFPKGRQVPQLA